ncbi:hypothetical protein [Actinoplanes sp. ATCC 53533]|uniref:hypothetical protein n=1 Tax=Actinoplanes sp. ATCC 53533 TaxID=1288362 RepID=UPI000F782E4D|nr:hypothetical protein [Actinoplanes sp. ATCC 53533]
MAVMVSASGQDWVVRDDMLDAVPIDFRSLLVRARGRRADLSERDGSGDLVIGAQSVKDLRPAGHWCDQ